MEVERHELRQTWGMDDEVSLPTWRMNGPSRDGSARPARSAFHDACQGVSAIFSFSFARLARTAGRPARSELALSLSGAAADVRAHQGVAEPLSCPSSKLPICQDPRRGHTSPFAIRERESRAGARKATKTSTRESPSFHACSSPIAQARHMLPSGKKDRPIYPGASQSRAKGNCGLVPFDFPSFGLRASSRCTSAEG